jgi:hypothetical protein
LQLNIPDCLIALFTVQNIKICCTEHLQEFAKSTWHPSIFGKTGKIMLQQFGIQLDKF